MMKKFGLIFVLMLAFAVILTGCGKEDTPYDYDLGEYVTLGEFPKVEIDMDEVQEKVDEAVTEIASEYAETSKVTDRPVKDGDIVDIDYTGKIDGKEFEGGSATGTELEIGSDSFIAGFEDGLIGKNIGDTVDLNLVFPEDYKSEDLQGKDVVFTVKINSITAKKVPALSNEMVEEKTDYSTVSEFLENTRKQTIEDMLWQNYLDSCMIIKYPEAEVKKYYDQMVQSYRQMAVYYGMNLENLVSMYGYSTVESFLDYALESAMLTVKEEIVIWKTVRDNDITLTDKEYKELGLEIAKEAGYETLKEYEEYVGEKNTIKLQIYMDKIVEMAIKANNITFEPVDEEVVTEEATDDAEETTTAPEETTEETTEDTTEDTTGESAEETAEDAVIDSPEIDEETEESAA